MMTYSICTATCVRTYFRLFEVSFKKFQNHVLFYQEPEPSQNLPAPKPCGPQGRLVPLSPVSHLNPPPLDRETRKWTVPGTY